MIQKIFTKLVIQLLRNLDEEIIKYLKNVTTLLKDQNKDIENLKKAVCWHNNLDSFVTWWGRLLDIEDFKAEMALALKEDYFTKEYLNEDATNTKELLVVENENITKVLYKEWNGTKDIKKIHWKEYLFIT